MDTLEDEPLIGCNISVGNKVVAATDLNGQFEVTLPNDSCIVEFRFLGNSTMRFTTRSLLSHTGDIYMFWDPLMFICGPDKKGSIIERYENGSVKIMVPFNRRGINGTCKKFDPNGKLQIEGRCRKGIQVGEWKYYKSNGEIITATFVNGIQIIE